MNWGKTEKQAGPTKRWNFSYWEPLRLSNTCCEPYVEVIGVSFIDDDDALSCDGVIFLLETRCHRFEKWRPVVRTSYVQYCSWKWIIGRVLKYCAFKRGQKKRRKLIIDRRSLPKTLPQWNGYKMKIVWGVDWDIIITTVKLHLMRRKYGWVNVNVCEICRVMIQKSILFHAVKWGQKTRVSVVKRFIPRSRNEFEKDVDQIALETGIMSESRERKMFYFRWCWLQ